MIIYLTRGQSPMRIPLNFPTTPMEIGEAYAKLDALDSGKTTHLMDIVSPVKKLKNYLCSIDLDSPGGIEKLNGLAQRVDALDEAKAALFTGALDAESVNGLDDVLRIADSLDDYTIISEVTSDRELGGYLVEHGFLQCPEELRPYLDYVSIGAEFYSDHGGAYELEGYVLRRSELPPCLSRVGLPEPWRDENRDEILCLELENGSQQYTLLLPADDEYLDDVCKYLGIEGFAEARIVEASCSVPYLSDLLPWDCVSVEDANELALAIEEMCKTDGELLKFCSALEVEQPHTFQAALELAMGLDDYERITEGTYEYGQSVLRRIGADDEVIDTIDGYMDFERFGEAMMAEDGVRQTEFGLIRRLSEPFPSQEQGQIFQ